MVICHFSHRQVLEEPRPHDVGSHFREDPPLLVVPLVLVGVVVVPRAGRSHPVVQAVTCPNPKQCIVGGCGCSSSYNTVKSFNAKGILFNVIVLIVCKTGSF